ncbi:MAG: [FeFe] hydrogenase H-cluster maturation GTPase HydF [Candidatus Cloacimonetes bacterium]|nr:[FeFe] hydrogenase H-cluster maturation GTPase HydF [Candidatus Cloacimonadota bacterium]
MAKAPRGERLIISIVGRRNTGKSSLINALVGQAIAIVSEEAGTTTDAVAKSYELLPLGPVTLYDTAGIDDRGELGDKRVKATERVLFRSDIVVMVIDETGITPKDQEILELLETLKIPLLVVFNKSDLAEVKPKDIKYCVDQGWPWQNVSTAKSSGIKELKDKLAHLAPLEYRQDRVLAGDLIKAGDVVLLIAPIDSAAPKGRLILPQVQILREILDNDAVGMIVKEREIEAALAGLAKLPDLVITDSQVVLKVDGDIPAEVPMTTFSILFARYKGDLDVLLDGVKKIDELADGDKILIAENCSHNVQCDDIGRVKIPRWLLQYTGRKLDFEVSTGHDFPEDLENYALILHCGGCMIGQTEMQRRIREAERRGVPITNYGLTISKLQGVLARTVKPLGYEISER